MIKPLNFLLLIFFVFGCNKDNSEPSNLSEILIGEWQLKESVEPSIYGDINWHEPNNPELNEVCFQQNSFTSFKYGSFGEEMGIYSVSNDTIFFSILWDFNWVVTDFDESELTVSLGTSPEGETKRRYTKIK